MAVSAGQRDGERGSVPVDDQVVLAAGAGPIDWRRSGVSPPLRALTCEPSIAASSISSRPSLRILPGEPRAVGAILQPRSSPADAARPSPRCSPPALRERPASSHPCATRKRCPAERCGHPPATARDADAFEAVAPGAAGLCVPTDHLAQGQQTPTRSCRPDTQLPSHHTDLILKRSVMGGGPRYAHLCGDMGDRTARAHSFDQNPPAVNGQPGITVGHEDLRVVQS